MNTATDKKVDISNQRLEDPVSRLTSIVSNARIDQYEWASNSFDERAEYLLKVRDYIIDNIDDWAKQISEENGKVLIDAIVGDLLPITIAISYYCKKGKKFLADKKLKSSTFFLSYKRSFERYVPWGVVAVISPWNYPVSIPMHDVVVGLLAGNAVILKPAKETFGIAQKIKEAFEHAGLPEFIFTLADLPGKVFGNSIFKAGIDKVFFTGSVEVGRMLMKKASETLTPVSLELGGNDPMIICEDADVTRAAYGTMWGAFHNSGQSCGGIERVYAHEKVYNEYLRQLKLLVEKHRVGKSDSFDSDMGRMTTENQIKIVNEHVEDALSKGAEIFARSAFPSNSQIFLPVTVLVNVNHKMKIMKEETFGPVIGIMKFSVINEAISLANDSNLGLSASVWSRDQKKAVSIAKRIHAGAVNINDHLMSHGLSETPWGGFKQSGFSRTHGEHGFREMTQTQVIIRDVFHFIKRDLWWHPYSKKLYDGLTGIVGFLYSSKITHKFVSIRKLLRILPRIFKT